MKGKFIVLEGGEGCGKSTQIQLLKERLSELYPGREILFTRELGGSEYADRIYELFKQGMATISPYTQIGMAFASRFDHLENVVRPALARGAIVVSDRYAPSTLAYQVMPAYDDLKPVFDAYSRLIDTPDLVIIIDVPVPVALARLAKRKGPASAFDKGTVEFHERIARGYHRYAREIAPGTTKLINGDRSPEEVHTDVIAAVRGVLGK